jgi:RsmE family RNA methyltransferase
MAEPGGQPPRLEWPVVLVGPEGGWSDEERERSTASVGLGPNVLRVETAAIAAAAILVGLRSRLVRPASV